MIIIMVTEMFTGCQKKDNQSMIQHTLTTMVMDIGDTMSGMDLDTDTVMMVIIIVGAMSLLREMPLTPASARCTAAARALGIIDQAAGSIPSAGQARQLLNNM